jgi:hypothetical protein
MRGMKSSTERESRLEWWRRQVSRQQSAGVSIAEFCGQLGVTVRTFNYWRDRVRKAQRTGSRRVAAECSTQSATPSATAGAASFVPVSILNHSASTQLEIELANGCAVRLTGPVDPGLLQAAIAAAGQFKSSGRGGR